MADEKQKWRKTIGWGIPVSILLHVVFAALLFFHLPLDFMKPQVEDVIQVEIVPPPEPEKPEAEEPPPEPEKPEEKPEKPPEAEEAKEEEPPPPENKAEQQPADEAAKQQPVPVLRPVFEFGEKDAGPKVATDGNASRPTAPPADEPEQSPEEPTPEQPPEEPEEAEPSIPETLAGNPSADSIAALAAVDVAPVTAEPVDQDLPELTETKTLFSEAATNDPVATRARDNVSRDVRVGELCATELREQLRHATPAYRPEILPAYRLLQGTVLDVRRAAFRAGGQWYDVGFRCEIDADASKVVTFAFGVGAPVPRDEWDERGFPRY